jgi:nitrile hydratase beta subunit-like protein
MTSSSLADVDRALALTAPLPRSNGELVFDEPWQGRALGMGIVALEQAGVSLLDFSRFLAEAVAKHGYDPAEPAASAYYSAWLDALEDALRRKGLDLT